MRTTEEIYQALLAGFRQRTGVAPENGCDLAVRLWAAAAQLQALEIQADWVLDQSFPQTAQGIWLDYHGQMRGISRQEAAKAVGTLRFTVESEPVTDMTIPADTVCMTAGEVRFRTLEDVILKAGTLSVDAAAEALEGGIGGNAAAGAVCILTACPVAITGCTNPGPFTGGRDAETDESLRERILESYRRLPNGANAAWYERTAMECDGVAAAKAVGRARGIGTVDVYIATESGLPDAELLEQVRSLLQEKREIAVDVAAKAPVVKTVNVELEILPAEHADPAEAISQTEQVVRDFFTGRLLGKPVLLAELGSRVYGLDSVANYRFLNPGGDAAAGEAVLPVLGALQVTEMEA